MGEKQEKQEEKQEKEEEKQEKEEDLNQTSLEFEQLASCSRKQEAQESNLDSKSLPENKEAIEPITKEETFYEKPKTEKKDSDANYEMQETKDSSSGNKKKSRFGKKKKKKKKKKK